MSQDLTISEPIQQKRDVSNAEFEAALADRDNQNIIKGVTSRYKKQLDADDLYTCGLNALWRALQSHDPAYEQKFTTTLFRFVHWECRRELRSRRGWVASRSRPLADEDDHHGHFKQSDATHRENVEIMRQCMDALLPEHRHAVEQYFRREWTVEEIGIL